MAVAVLALLGACGDDDGGGLAAAVTTTPSTEAPLPACTDLAGTPVDELQADSDALVASCTGTSGPEALGFAFYDCPDGRRLVWNDYGWGYSGGTWQAHARADGQLVPPDEDMAACS